MIWFKDKIGSFRQTSVSSFKQTLFLEWNCVPVIKIYVHSSRYTPWQPESHEHYSYDLLFDKHSRLKYFTCQILTAELWSLALHLFVCSSLLTGQGSFAPELLARCGYWDGAVMCVKPKHLVTVCRNNPRKCSPKARWLRSYFLWRGGYQTPHMVTGSWLKQWGDPTGLPLSDKGLPGARSQTAQVSEAELLCTLIGAADSHEQAGTARSH